MSGSMVAATFPHRTSTLRDADAGYFAEGTVYSEPVISIDVSQTVLALAGAKLDEDPDGVNLFPFVLTEQKTP